MTHGSGRETHSPENSWLCMRGVTELQLEKLKKRPVGHTIHISPCLRGDAVVWYAEPVDDASGAEQLSGGH